MVASEEPVLIPSGLGTYQLEAEMRVAIGGFNHETNTFAPSKARYEDFQASGSWPGLVSGGDLFGIMQGVNIPISGFISQAKRFDWTLLPLTWAAATPSAHVTEDAYERIVGMILDQLRDALPVNAVYLCLHGAMVAEHAEDGEGELLARVRALIGPDIPLVASLDLHGNITQKMVDQSDGLISFRTYPHVDMAQTGGQTADYLNWIRNQDLAKRGKVLVRIPFLIPISWQCTEMEPNRSIMNLLREVENKYSLVLSYCPGFPASDFPDCGPTILAYSDAPGAAAEAAQIIKDAVLAVEGELVGTIYSPHEAVREAMRLARQPGSGPVVISDTQDNPGAGGNGDTMGMLRALLDVKVPRSAFGLICDPRAAEVAHGAGVGADIRIELGGKSGVAGDQPYSGTFRVRALSDGKVNCCGPYYAGARMTLGLSACLAIGNVSVAVCSRKVQMADQDLYRFVGIEPMRQVILVNKSSVHFRADFAQMARGILIAAAPGSMTADPADLPWTRLPDTIRRRPIGLIGPGVTGRV